MIDLTEIKAKIKAEVADRSARTKAIQKESEVSLQEHFKEIPKAFFEKWPDVYAIFWRQYTPNFNDGEECVFSVGSFYMALTENQFENSDEPNYNGCVKYLEMAKKYGGDYEDEVNEILTHPYYSRFEELDKDWIEFRSFLASFDEDAFHGVFGDHATVILSKDGVDVEEYEDHY